ncbi:hypothetical protein TSUD_200470 [Trifolium subterraneum]|nr:hypothetical protein TSUD_200470 [Trifolium subterraneum]
MLTYVSQDCLPVEIILQIGDWANVCHASPGGSVSISLSNVAVKLAARMGASASLLSVPDGVELVFAYESCYSDGLLKMGNIMPFVMPPGGGVSISLRSVAVKQAARMSASASLLSNIATLLNEIETLPLWGMTNIGLITYLKYYFNT